MTLRGLIIILFGVSLAFTAYLYADYKRTGGFEENTSEYYGYRYFTDNNITDLKSCEEVDKEYEEPSSKEWMIGCKKFLEMHKK